MLFCLSCGVKLGSKFQNRYIARHHSYCFLDVRIEIRVYQQLLAVYWRKTAGLFAMACDQSIKLFERHLYQGQRKSMFRDMMSVQIHSFVHWSNAITQRVTTCTMGASNAPLKKKMLSVVSVTRIYLLHIQKPSTMPILKCIWVHLGGPHSP